MSGNKLKAESVTESVGANSINTNSMDVIEAIQLFFAAGLCAFPLNIRLIKKNGNVKKQSTFPIKWKLETVTLENALQIFDPEQHNAVALLTGKKYNLLVMDLDVTDGKSGIEYLQDQGISIAETVPRVRSQSGGLHFYFAFPDNFDGKTTKSFKEHGVDFRGDGGLIYVPPTSFPDSQAYEWEVPLTLPLSEPSSKLLELLAGKTQVCPESSKFDSKASGGKRLLDVSRKQRELFYTKLRNAENCPVGERSEADFAVIAWGINIGLSREEIFNNVKDVGKFSEKARSRNLDSYFEITYQNALQQVQQIDSSGMRGDNLSSINDNANDLAEEGTRQKKPTQSQLLAQIAEPLQLFSDFESEKAYVTMEVDGHYENWLVRSSQFRRWLTVQFFEIHDRPPSSQPFEEALRLIEAKANFKSPNAPVFRRVAEHEGRIYVDLCNDTWQAIEISSEGWRLVQNPPVKFVRFKAMAALPNPVLGGQIEELYQFVNLSDARDWILLVSWLVAGFHPSGPYPLLVLQGEQGSGKSTFSRLLKSIIDPSHAPLRSTPRDERDLMIAANNSWLLSFDNLSGIQNWLSDALCRLSTGGGFSTRELYTDSEEVIIKAKRPVIVNGIDELLYRHDLIDRAIVLNLQALKDGQRIDEKSFWQKFEQCRGQILAGLLNAISMALRELDSIQLDTYPRMADFTRWVVAAEKALPWEHGAFQEAYTTKRTEAVDDAIQEHPFGSALVDLIKANLAWEGSATELLTELENRVNDNVKRQKMWPTSAKGVGRTLTRLGSFLRRSGISFEKHRRNSKRLLRIELQKNVTNVTDVTKQAELQEKESIMKSDKTSKSPQTNVTIPPNGNPNIDNTSQVIRDKSDKSDDNSAIDSKHLTPDQLPF